MAENKNEFPRQWKTPAPQQGNRAPVHCLDAALVAADHRINEIPAVLSDLRQALCQSRVALITTNQDRLFYEDAFEKEHNLRATAEQQVTNTQDAYRKLFHEFQVLQAFQQTIMRENQMLRAKVRSLEQGQQQTASNCSITEEANSPESYRPPSATSTVAR